MKFITFSIFFLYFTVAESFSPRPLLQLRNFSGGEFRNTSLSAKFSNSLKISKANLVSALLVIAGSVMTATIFNIINWSKTFDTASDIPGDFYKQHQTIYGKVVKVIDGDTYRVRHLPLWFSKGDYKGLLSEKTILVRIAAVDTPETAKFGNEGQPLGKIATDFAKTRLLNKKVAIKLLARDQYARAISSVSYQTSYFSSHDISEELLKNGLAYVYRQGGAQYGDYSLKKWTEIESKAKLEKKGVWANEDFESPAEYKKRTKK